MSYVKTGAFPGDHMKSQSLTCLLVLFWATGSSSIAAAADYRVDRGAAVKANRGVVVVQLREDSFMGSPEGRAMPGQAHSSTKIDISESVIAKGVYSSPYQGFQLLIPRVAGDINVSVSQALIARRPDGTPITSDVIVTPTQGYGAAALVVTRMRDDAPKDPDHILAEFEPRNSAEYAAYEKQGVAFERRQGPLGLALERLTKNRVVTEYFPYRTGIDPHRANGSLGISRYVVIGEFLCEFSLVIDGSPTLNEDALRALAESAMDSFMGALLKEPH